MKNTDWRTDLESYKEALIGGLADLEEVEAEIKEMKDAPIGYIKPNYWEKVSDDEFIIFEM